MRLIFILTFLVFVAIKVSTAPTNAVSKETTPDKSPRKPAATIDLEQQLQHQVSKPSKPGSTKRPVKEQDGLENIADDNTDYNTDDNTNLDAASMDIEEVLRYFFIRLKDHPEIVQAMIEKEGEKLLNAPSETKPIINTEDDTDTKLETEEDEDLTRSFEKPSPQLQQIPKRVEKKGGVFPSQLKFSFEPVEGEENKYELQPAMSFRQNSAPELQSLNSLQHNLAPESQSLNSVEKNLPDAQSNAITNYFSSAQHALSPEKTTDLNTQQKTKLQNDIVSTATLKDSSIDVSGLKRDQEAKSRSQSFVNSLPMFHHKPTKTNTDVEQLKNKDVSTGSKESQSSEELENENDDSSKMIHADPRSEPNAYTSTEVDDVEGDNVNMPDQQSYYYYYNDDDDDKTEDDDASMKDVNEENIQDPATATASTPTAAHDGQGEKPGFEDDDSEHLYKEDDSSSSEDKDSDKDNTKNAEDADRHKIILIPAEDGSDQPQVDANDEKELLSLTGKGLTDEGLTKRYAM
ncbi:eisosome protein SEG2-like [Gigantopelta aegis]|uniref:eisosome protein SEG2-like n=1 Tax=Gigantopelta aegis TaxID=1735272 RepID=UPI001B88E6FD|nr:eisosome protein SEG2-like [Gigantopelta aegis]